MKNQEFSRGQKLRLTLVDGVIYEGPLYFKNDFKIALKGAVEYPSNYEIDIIQYFCWNEIRNIETLSEGTKPKITLKKTETARKQTEKKTFDKKELENLENLSQSYISVEAFDKNFNDAVSYLLGCETVSVDVKGSEQGRNSFIHVLVLASWEQVYTFDITLLKWKAFDNGLKEILESEQIVKVVHDSRTLSDCLFHKYKVILRNVFDTKVVDIILTKKKNPDSMLTERSLSQCLTKYFDVPEVDNIEDDTSCMEWTKRPLPDDCQRFVSQKIVYLILLKDTLIKEMSEVFNENVKKRLNMFRNSKDPLESILNKQLQRAMSSSLS